MSTVTVYRPVHADGRKGQAWPSLRMACLWVVSQPSIEGWTVEHLRREAGEPVPHDAESDSHDYPEPRRQADTGDLSGCGETISDLNA